jgi:hypothetical protein
MIGFPVDLVWARQTLLRLARLNENGQSHGR